MSSGRRNVGGRSGGNGSGRGVAPNANDQTFGSFDINTDQIESFARALENEDQFSLPQNPPQHQPNQYQSNQSSSSMPPPSTPRNPVGAGAGSDPNTEGGDDSIPTITTSSGKRGHTSWVWPYYDKVATNEVDKFNAICKVCRDVNKAKDPKSYKWTKCDGTGTLARHLKNDHKLGPKGEERTFSGQAQLHGYATTTPGAGMPFIYNRDRMIDEFAKYVILDELPFSHGESLNYEYFNRVAMQPAYRRIPRNTLKRRTQKLFWGYRGYLTEMFRTFDGRVSITSDTWTSFVGEPFICVTVHWIDHDWFLQKRIISFEAMEETHTGFNIKTRIVNTLKYYHLSEKLFSISFDNATANTRAIDFFKQDTDVPMLLNGILFHVRCCAHILNLSVQEGITELQPLLQPIRSVVRWIRVTRSIKRAYKKKCDERGLKKKCFSIDTPTRWNSTFKLLCDAIKYRDVLTELYNETRSDPNELITNNHWSIAMVVRDLLSSFDHATNIFSYIYEPSVHLVILEAAKIVHAISEAMNSAEIDNISNILDRMKLKWYNYFSEFPYIYGIAVILDPGLKIDGLKSLLTFYYECLGSAYDVESYITQCKTILDKLYDHYSSIYQPESASQPKPKSRDPFLASILKKSRVPTSSASSSSPSVVEGSGMDDYLSYQFETNENFHIIKWWQNHSTQFPILSRIAKDILAVPASTVASESAFSAGKRVLDEKRSRLHPESIEMCVCKKDWDQAENRIQGLKEDDEDEDDPWMLMDTSESDASLSGNETN